MLFILSLVAGLIIGSVFLVVALLIDRTLKTPAQLLEDVQDAPSFSLVTSH